MTTQAPPRWAPPPPDDRQPPAAEWRLPEQPPKPKKSHGLLWALIGAGVAVLLIGGIVAGIVASSGGGTKTVHISTPAVTTPAPTTPPTYTVPTTPGLATVTRANYDAIHAQMDNSNMTLAQVEQVLGPPSSHRAGPPTMAGPERPSVETYVWNGSNGSRIEVGLNSQGIVYDMARFNLP